MFVFKPHSITQLTITGFLAITVLLLAALFITGRQLEKLGDSNQRIISQSFLAISAGRTLIDQTLAMERNLRQYTITGNEELLQFYHGRRNTFREGLDDLGRINLTPVLSGKLEEIGLYEESLFMAIEKSGATAALASQFPSLLEMANEISDMIATWSNDQALEIEQETERTKNFLVLQSVLLVTSAILLMIFFTTLISRPLLQLGRYINNLGNGQYQDPVVVSGPKDIMELGSRLDWLRERLEKLEQIRTSFLRHVSHELKTPLAAIQESTSLLRDGVVGELTADQCKILDIQSKNCQRLQGQINELLKSQLESIASLNAKPESILLKPLVEEIVDAYRLVIQSGKLVITLALDPVTVTGDREKLHAVIDNLVSNAIKFSPDGGKVTLKLWQEGNQAYLEIQDQGEGVSREEAGRIFEAFYQGKARARDTFKGSGLGLAIAEEYIKVHNGMIELVPSAIGANFRMTLPVRLQS